MSRRKDPVPHLELGLGTRLSAKAAGITDIQGVLQFMMDTAVETKAITALYLQAAEETNVILADIRDEIKRRPS
ncbi:MAG: hypothetical protein L3K18_09480 [Thermoplasmata archaeon]|nr:hypothetical protein [Thermoplasmata archaeon]